MWLACDTVTLGVKESLLQKRKVDFSEIAHFTVCLHIERFLEVFSQLVIERIVVETFTGTETIDLHWQ